MYCLLSSCSAHPEAKRLPPTPHFLVCEARNQTPCACERFPSSADALCLRACRSPGQSTKQAIPNPNPVIQAPGGGIYASPYPLHGSGSLPCWRFPHPRWLQNSLKINQIIYFELSPPQKYRVTFESGASLRKNCLTLYLTFMSDIYI